MAERVNLTLDGVAWYGWKSVSITRSVQTLSGGFSLTLADRWEADGLVLAVTPDQPCTVSLGPDVVITGHVDEVNPELSEGSHEISVSGRDAAADLVDCSAVHEPGEWAGPSLVEVATRLAAPFGVRVLSPILTPERFEKFAVQPGETAFAALERACRLRGVLAMSDGLGSIVLAEPGSERADEALVYGQNVKSARAKFSRKGRFSHYIVKGQNQGSDDSFGPAVAQVSATARDAALTRYRPLLITAEGRASTLTTRDRARWEAVVRAGRAAQVTVTVPGWRQGSGKLWPINALVPVHIPALGLDREMLITSTTFSLSASGSTTNLTLMRPDAFASQAAFKTPEPTVRQQGDIWPEPGSDPATSERWGR